MLHISNIIPFFIMCKIQIPCTNENVLYFYHNTSKLISIMVPCLHIQSQQKHSHTHTHTHTHTHSHTITHTHNYTHTTTRTHRDQSAGGLRWAFIIPIASRVAYISQCFRQDITESCNSVLIFTQMGDTAYFPRYNVFSPVSYTFDMVNLKGGYGSVYQGST